ncbi:MAG TPA: FAD-dependent oxidoreductase [Enhygromyxa sp.]|nr:FAD-dependent oxidoreductase [Enhygromyxa sp.]
MQKKKVAVVGGGATGVSLLWAITSQPRSRREVELTLFHDEDKVGGHSRTIPVLFDAHGRGHVAEGIINEPTYAVDIGVQFVCETLYPNLYLMLEDPWFKAKVKLHRHPELKISGTFRDNLNWGNFDPYQHGPKFDACYTPDAVRDAKRFQRDMHFAYLQVIKGKRMWKMSVGEYLDKRGYSREGNFFRYMLIPYLSIINGYGTTDLLESSIRDLFPIFAKLPTIQEVGPYASFTKPGTGWDRFRDGAQTWVEAMAYLARTFGAKIETDTIVTSVRPTPAGQVCVVWKDQNGAEQADVFDQVVLTTDMNVNRKLLNNPHNRYWDQQAEYIAADKFELIPGVCYIHQDKDVLAPPLRDDLEDGQFNCYFCWDPSSGNVMGLPYKLEQSFQTYHMQNILGTPFPCYVSMYSKDEGAVVPRPETIIYKKTWVHGRWLAGFFDKAKRELHEIQGLGNVWFAGNNTSVDSEEGALISAMIIAERISSFQYPWRQLGYARTYYEYFLDMMFPKPSPFARMAERGRSEYEAALAAEAPDEDWPEHD